MPVFRTSEGRIVVHHCHIAEPNCGKKELTAAQIAAITAILSAEHPNANVVGSATREYNCHGFSLAASHGFFEQPAAFFTDDHFEVSFDDPLEGDVVVYINDGDPAHTGVVIAVQNNRITRVRSKWGGWPVVEHDLHDVRDAYGVPRTLLRRKPDIVPLESLTGDEDMTEAETKQEIIESALRSFSDPHVYLQVLLASTPEVARKIIAELPGVKALLALGPEAGRAALRFLEREETRESEELSSIALYILQRVRTEEAVRPLARAYSEGEFTGLSRHLAADALLTSAGIEVVSEDPMTAASRAAEEIKARE